jgi:hypothetical protein
VCCRTCTRTPCRSTFRYIGSWAPSPWLLIDVHAEHRQAHSRGTLGACAREQHSRTNYPKLAANGPPSVPAASASPAMQTSASTNAVARKSVARGELRLGPHAARPRSNSLSWAIVLAPVLAGTFFLFFFQNTLLHTQRPRYGQTLAGTTVQGRR